MWHAGVYAALRAAGKKADLSLVVADEPAVAAGCFTKNVMCAAPVLYCKDVLDRNKKVKAVRDSVPGSTVGSTMFTRVSNCKQHDLPGTADQNTGVFFILRGCN
jgi:hypothetical protein